MQAYSINIDKSEEYLEWMQTTTDMKPQWSATGETTTDAHGQENQLTWSECNKVCNPVSTTVQQVKQWCRPKGKDSSIWMQSFNKLNKLNAKIQCLKWLKYINAKDSYMKITRHMYNCYTIRLDNIHRWKMEERHKNKFSTNLNQYTWMHQASADNMLEAKECNNEYYFKILIKDKCNQMIV